MHDDPTTTQTTPEPILRPEARIVRADRSLAAMVLLVCTLGGMGIGFGSAMYLMRMQWNGYPPPAAINMRTMDGCRDVTAPTTITWLGVGIRSYAGREGTMVLRVFEGTAAQRAGLLPGDTVLSFDGERITSADSMVTAVRSHNPGQLVNIDVLRNGQQLTLQARLGRR